MRARIISRGDDASQVTASCSDGQGLVVRRAGALTVGGRLRHIALDVEVTLVSDRLTASLGAL